MKNFNKITSSSYSQKFEDGMLFIEDPYGEQHKKDYKLGVSSSQIEILRQTLKATQAQLDLTFKELTCQRKVVNSLNQELHSVYASKIWPWVALIRKYKMRLNRLKALFSKRMVYFPKKWLGESFNQTINFARKSAWLCETFKLNDFRRFLLSRGLLSLGKPTKNPYIGVGDERRMELSVRAKELLQDLENRLRDCSFSKETGLLKINTAKRD